MANDIENLQEELRAVGENAEISAQQISDLGQTLQDMEKAGHAFSKGLERDLMGAMRALVVEGDSLSDTFRSLALSIADRSLNAAMTPVMQMVSSQVGSLLPFANGGVVTPQVHAFAQGGVVNNPTYFPMRDGVGLMGEAGAEAIMPLKRGSDGRLGVASANRASKALNITMNINSPDEKGFRKSQTQIVAQLKRALNDTVK